MSLSPEDVRHVARLARLSLTEDEVEAAAEELSKILTYAAEVGEVATEAVPPTGHPYPLRNVTRADEPRSSLPPDVAVSTAPAPEDGRFRVPRIVGEGA